MDDNKLKLRKKGSYSPDGGEIQITGILQERRKPDGRRRLKLTDQERSMFLRQQKVDRAVLLYLDLETPHTMREIASELGMSIPALKDLTKTKEFMDTYSAHFVELGHDPRVKAAQGAIVDMLPLAINTMRNLLTEPATPASIRLQAAKEVMRQAGVDIPDGKVNDRGELANFLKDAGVTIGQVNIGLPPQPETSTQNFVDAEFHSDNSEPTTGNSGSSLLPDGLEDIPA